MKFKDPIQPKHRLTSKFAVAPTKDQATTGRFMNYGDDYGTGFNQPVGTEKQTKKEVIPQKAFCMSPEDLRHD